jgi:sugar phosphate isomerase/epimerase
MIFISTGCLPQKTAVESAKIMIDHGFKAIELSGGVYSPTLLSDLKSLSSKCHFRIHNYFPPSQASFVLNLASLDSDINKMSVEHCKKAIRFAVSLGDTVYAFHAGYLFDPKPSELGQVHGKHKLYNTNESLNRFIDRVNSLSEFAEREGVKLLIENNVISKNNFEKFGEDPLLMTTAEEAEYIMKNTNNKVGLLLDVAHLKVSANTLGFDPIDYFILCNEWIEGYHLSDNDGYADSNHSVKENSWFWSYLKDDLNYHTLEVYSTNMDTLKKQMKLTLSKLRSEF